MAEVPDFLLSLLIPYLWPDYHPYYVCKAWTALTSIKTRFWCSWIDNADARRLFCGKMRYNSSLHPEMHRRIQQRQHARLWMMSMEL